MVAPGFRRFRKTISLCRLAIRRLSGLQPLEGQGRKEGFFMATTEQAGIMQLGPSNRKFVFGILGVLIVGILAGFGSKWLAGSSAGTFKADAINTGDTAWVLVSAALVMVMIPAVGFFYGGMVRSNNVVCFFKQSLLILA